MSDSNLEKKSPPSISDNIFPAFGCAGALFLAVILIGYSIDYLKVKGPEILNSVKSFVTGSHPSLHDSSTFSFVAESGRSCFFRDGKLEEDEAIKNPGESNNLRFVILGDKKAMIIGNQGSGDVAFYKANDSISFVETTLGGNQHIFKIYDEWLPEKNGFRCEYVRNIFDPILLQGTLQSSYSGYAVPTPSKP